MRRLITAIIVGAGLALIPIAAFAHSVATVQGTVNCSGGYSITATGDVYGTTNLVVDLGGTTISDAPTGQSGPNGDSNVYGPFTGSGATAGEAISAEPSDGGPGANGVLVASPAVCPTPTPTPTATPPPTPTPSATPPPVAPAGTNTPTTGAGPGLIIGALALLLGLGLIMFTAGRRYLKRI
jgi:hypothetical protein